mmetsp:Transcript_29376/g.63357  ORF Transcript_29376/g.63357 Transcript_29376/m.63357 type:complete len:303 (-) Transcript_29376:401-1309(-)
MTNPRPGPVGSRKPWVCLRADVSDRTRVYTRSCPPLPRSRHRHHTCIRPCTNGYLAVPGNMASLFSVWRLASSSALSKANSQSTTRHATLISTSCIPGDCSRWRVVFVWRKTCAAIPTPTLSPYLAPYTAFRRQLMIFGESRRLSNGSKCGAVSSQLLQPSPVPLDVPSSRRMRVFVGLLWLWFALPTQLARCVPHPNTTTSSPNSPTPHPLHMTPPPPPYTCHGSWVEHKRCGWRLSWCIPHGRVVCNTISPLSTGCLPTSLRHGLWMCGPYGPGVCSRLPLRGPPNGLGAPHPTSRSSWF